MANGMSDEMRGLFDRAVTSAKGALDADVTPEQRRTAALDYFDALYALEIVSTWSAQWWAKRVNTRIANDDAANNNR